MERILVQSSNLVSVGFEGGTLEIEFRDSIYQYFNVPEFVYRGLMDADSHGTYFDIHVKKAGYSYIKIK